MRRQINKSNKKTEWVIERIEEKAVFLLGLGLAVIFGVALFTGILGAFYA